MDTKSFLEITFVEIITVWDKLCSLHSELFDKTCDEYMDLLASDIEALETTVEKKNEILAEIEAIDKERLKIINNLNEQNIFTRKIEKSSQLIEEFGKFSYLNTDHFRKQNDLLINIIENIQEQNKKNQIFLNKALLSLDEIRNSFMGNKKNLTTYNPKGKAVVKRV